MKKMMLKAARTWSHVAAALALVITASSVNSACVFIVHQPDVPEGAARLKKHEADS